MGDAEDEEEERVAEVRGVQGGSGTIDSMEKGDIKWESAVT